MSNFVNQQLSTEEIDVILAGLRLVQRTSSYDIPDSIQEIAGRSLETVNIDRLCERLNLDGIAQEQAQIWLGYPIRHTAVWSAQVRCPTCLLPRQQKVL